MPRGFSKEAEIEIEKRRKVVTANLAAGLSYRDIAAYLGVSISTISNDVKVVIKRLRTAQETDYVEYSRSKCAELTQLSTQFGGKYCKAIYPRFDNSYSYKTNGQSF